MPGILVKVEYVLTMAAPFVDMESIDFNKEVSADLDQDRVASPPPHYKSNPPSVKDACYVHPKNQFMNIFAVGRGQTGFKFSMTVTFTRVRADNLQQITPPFSPTNPILEATVNDEGIATLDMTVNWVK